ncbi:MAG: hypothetical protein MJ163_01485, partial [Alphaproteobacteria bacterium]|nr:hypothetical protein [Alphaproteobacteria bacterium]
FGMSVVAAGQMFFGAGEGTWSRASWGFQLGLANSSGSSQWGRGNGASCVISTDLKVVANRFYRWKISKNGVYVDGVLRSQMSSISNYTSNIRSLWIGKTNNADASSYNSGKSSWSYVNIYNDSGEIVFNGIPAKRNSDNVVGMWDTVTKTFFTNAGSGTFTAGPAVQ